MPNPKTENTVIIVGAGPAGLTAAYELATQSNYKVIVLEATESVGGISKTVDYKGNKIDIGGHRFFSQSDWVVNWWQQFMPIYHGQENLTIAYQGKKKKVKPNLDTISNDGLMVRPRKSRIYYKQHLFDYPIKINTKTLFALGIFKAIRIVFSLQKAKLFPIRKEKNLEDFFINRFGKELYETFFKFYTEKVWGKPCTEISAEWGRQRVKSLSLKKILLHYFNVIVFPSRRKFGNTEVERSLTEYFLYPPKGPGQLWEIVAKKCQEKGVTILMNHRLEEVLLKDENVSEVLVKSSDSEEAIKFKVDYLISSMPVKHLVEGIKPKLEEKAYDIGSSLEYRDFLIVGVLLKDLKIKENGNNISDNWLYIQDQGYEMGRVQLFHNWSKEMLADPNTYWIGAEYFCNEGDDIWSLSENTMADLAIEELCRIGIIDKVDVLDHVVVKMPKAYPSYIGTYAQFKEVRKCLDKIENLFLIGRNGKHRYNNQDHSMLSAKEAVKNILNSNKEKENIWKVNTEQEYLES